MRLEVAVDDVVRVEVEGDVRQPVGDELALVPLQRALLQVVGERLLAVLEHDAVLLAVGVLVVVDQFDDKLGAQRLEERHLAHEPLLVGHELERHLPLGLHVDRQLDQVEAAHARLSSSLYRPWYRSAVENLPCPTPFMRRDRRRQLLARPERGDPHLAQVGGRELDQRLEVDLLADEDARVLAQPEALEPRDQLVAALVALVAALPRACFFEVAVDGGVVHDARVQSVQSAPPPTPPNIKICEPTTQVAWRWRGEGRHARDVRLRPRHRIDVEHVDPIRRVPRRAQPGARRPARASPTRRRRRRCSGRRRRRCGRTAGRGGSARSAARSSSSRPCRGRGGRRARGRRRRRR